MIFRKIAKDSAIYGGADFLSKAIAFFTFPLIAAAFSPKVYGALELIGTTTTLLGMVVGCGLNNSVQRFYWDKDTAREMQPSIVTSGMYAQFAFAVLGVALGLAVIPWLMPLIERAGWPLTWVALVSALFLMALSQWSQYALDVLRLHFAPWRFLSLSLASRVAGIAMGLVAVLFLGLGADGLLGAQALVMLLIMPLALWMIRKDFRPASFHRGKMIELVRFGYPFIFANFAFWLFSSMDRWMLASMASVEEVGTFSVAHRYATLVFFVSTAFGQAWSPVVMKLRTDHPDQYRRMFGQVFSSLLFVMLALGGGVALFAGEIIAFMLPAEYSPSALPLVILCFAFVLQSTVQVTAVGISIEKQTHLFVRMSWLTALLNLALNWLLIPPLGATGAAWATLVSYLALTAGYLYYTQRLHPIQLQWKSLAALSSLGLVVGAVSMNSVETAPNGQVMAMKLGFGCVCLLVGWQLLPFKTFSFPWK